ncbi:MAG: STAS/SEC14 domain-containing protein [Candidatus Aminicenantes bacterium]|nr:STAS/SEC14 domain-containing protein [Candidatus Aminicenantes bacterium]NIM79892.1 STAS/SEC14 domain-containing protein [Candidatus Aminicenantes bacterium]NIN19229.1 STAS/SEC14 domain-containing protein [Candidatus Aminicenantes bacterium]NIN43134.1 STAS/SEC14 domain-containing protein [Candidatus Aminicenantes bacterium]NIN85871.1 STAS/SEC14 domain-containing protein [Candidatus Aminicenantes bacterium]
MPTVQVKAQLSTDDLMQAVKQLSPSELEGFVSHIIAFQAHQKAPGLSKDESELLLKINQGVPPDIQERYDELIAKRQSETLTPGEYDELLRITDQVEKLDAARVEYLKELARIRQTSLTALMEDLRIRTPANG